MNTNHTNHEPRNHPSPSWPVSMAPPRSAPGPSLDQMERAKAAADHFAAVRAVSIPDSIKALDGLTRRLDLLIGDADPFERSQEWVSRLRFAVRAIEQAASYLEDAEEQKVEGP